MLSEIPQDTSGQITQTYSFCKKLLRTHMTSPNSSHLYSGSQVHMTAAESLGSHQLNSFAAFLEDKLHTSSENSIVQNSQLKKMADDKTAFEIPDDIYEE
jgi:hypothetical protein